MPQKIVIYVITCEIPDAPIDLPIGANKFVRTEIPEIFKDIDYDEEGRAIYTKDHMPFISQEIERCINGYFFMNGNLPTYITGFHYYYLNYWVLENGLRPDYRDSDRRFFIFFDECYNDPKILGIVRGKKRREGASSQGACISVRIASFESNKNCGTVSMNDEYAEKLFQTMIVHGYYKLPDFLRVRVDNSGTNKKKLHFIDPPKRGKNRSSSVEGRNSIIDFMSTMLNSYDSTRLSYLLGDEWGKWERIDINRYFEVVKECVKVGARKVGFIYAPTTVNPPTKGGDNFKILWDGSNQFDTGRETSTGLVKYFQSAWDGMDGFIDEYGYSVIAEPDEKTLEYLVRKQAEIPDKKERIPIEDLRKGAKKYLEDEYKKLKTEEQKSDFKRKFPIQEDDMFDFGMSYSPFNLANIKQRKNELYHNPTPLRRGNLKLLKNTYMAANGDDVTKYEVEFQDNEAGYWLIYELPKKPNAFEIDWERKVVRPTNTLEYGGGADTFKFDKTVELGSKGVIWIGSKLDISKYDDEQGGIPCAYYIDRPKLTEFFWEQMLLASLYWGCTITVEKDATDEFRKYFANRMPNLLGLNCLPLLGRKPDAAIDPTRTNNQKNMLDTSSGDPFVFAKQIYLGQVYFEKYCNKIHFPQLLEEAEKFNPDKRTPYDTVMGFLMMLLNICGESKARAMDYSKEPLIKTYVIK